MLAPKSAAAADSRRTLSPAARGQLRAQWAGRLARTDPAQAAVQLRLAADEADLGIEDNGLPERAILLITRARQAVRRLAAAIDPPITDLPVWAAAALPEHHIDLINAYGRADDWPAEQAALDPHLRLLISGEFRATHEALTGLYPANPIPARLQGLLAEIDTVGIDTVFRARAADHHRRALLSAWIATTTWSDSQAFLIEHHAELTTDEIGELLGNTDHDTAGQHLAILQLATAFSIERVYELVTDPAEAETVTLEAVENGDLALLSAVLTASQALRQREITYALAAAVLLLAQDDHDQARAVAAHIAENAGATQRRTHTIRLRKFREHHPDLAGLDTVIDIIDSATEADPGAEPDAG